MKACARLRLQESISWVNVSTYFLIQFGYSLAISFMNTFLSYLVKSTEYYKVPKAEAGETIGNLTFYAELAIIPSHLLLGTIMDSFGRRVPTCIGLLVTGISIACMPYGHEIYPDLCVMR